MKPRTLSLCHALLLAAVPILIGLTLVPMTGAHTPSQSTSANASKFEYEVATIKPSDPNAAMSGMNYPADGFTAMGQTLRFLIQEAFGVENYQLSGGPAWLNSEKYDVDAKMEGAIADALKKFGPTERGSMRRQMLLAILVDRLKLTFHRDTKELAMFSLVIAKGGPKLQESKSVDANAAASGARVGLWTSTFPGSVSAKGQSVPLADLAQMLTERLGRIVMDKTGLTGKYDFTLKWATDDAQMQMPPNIASGTTPPTFPTDSGNLVLSTAIQQQLGLKLELGKGPVEVIVIDHIERPSGN